MEITPKQSRLAALIAVAAVGGALAAPIALGGGPTTPPSKSKCNSGRGNGSELCDPGNSSTSPSGSAGQNMGGDEGGPVSGGTGTP